MYWNGNGMSVCAFILCAGMSVENETADATGDGDQSIWKTTPVHYIPIVCTILVSNLRPDA